MKKTNPENPLKDFVLTHIDRVNPYSEIATVRGDTFDSPSKYDEGLYIGMDQNEVRAANQGGLSALGNSLTQLVAGTLGGAISIPGLLANNPVTGYDSSLADFGELFINAGNAIVESGSDLAPIFVSKDSSEKIFAPFDLEWTANSIAQFGPTLALMVGSFASEGLLMPALAKRLGSMSKAVAGLIGKADDVDVVRKIIQGGRAGIVNRVMEAGMESHDTYKQLYQYALQNGATEEKALKAAKDGASEVWMRNLPLALVDAVQYFSIFGKMKGFAGGAATVGGNMAGEAGEEIYQYGVQEEARTDASVALGLTEEDTTVLDEIFEGDREMWQAAVQGAMGGAVFAGIGKLLKQVPAIKKGLKRNIKRIKEIQNADDSDGPDSSSTKRAEITPEIIKEAYKEGRLNLLRSDFKHLGQQDVVDAIDLFQEVAQSSNAENVEVLATAIANASLLGKNRKESISNIKEIKQKYLEDNKDNDALFNILSYVSENKALQKLKKQKNTDKAIVDTIIAENKEKIAKLKEDAKIKTKSYETILQQEILDKETTSLAKTKYSEKVINERIGEVRTNFEEFTQKEKEKKVDEVEEEIKESETEEELNRVEKEAEENEELSEEDVDKIKLTVRQRRQALRSQQELFSMFANLTEANEQADASINALSVLSDKEEFIAEVKRTFVYDENDNDLEKIFRILYRSLHEEHAGEKIREEEYSRERKPKKAKQEPKEEKKEIVEEPAKELEFTNIEDDLASVLDLSNTDLYPSDLTYKQIANKLERSLDSLIENYSEEEVATAFYKYFSDTFNYENAKEKDALFYLELSSSKGLMYLTTNLAASNAELTPTSQEVYKYVENVVDYGDAPLLDSIRQLSFNLLKQFIENVAAYPFYKKPTKNKKAVQKEEKKDTLPSKQNIIKSNIDNPLQTLTQDIFIQGRNKMIDNRYLQSIASVFGLDKEEIRDYVRNFYKKTGKKLQDVDFKITYLKDKPERFDDKKATANNFNLYLTVEHEGKLIPISMLSSVDFKSDLLNKSGRSEQYKEEYQLLEQIRKELFSQREAEGTSYSNVNEVVHYSNPIEVISYSPGTFVQLDNQLDKKTGERSRQYETLDKQLQDKDFKPVLLTYDATSGRVITSAKKANNLPSDIQERAGQYFIQHIDTNGNQSWINLDIVRLNENEEVYNALVEKLSLINQAQELLIEEFGEAILEQNHQQVREFVKTEKYLNWANSITNYEAQEILLDPQKFFKDIAEEFTQLYSGSDYKQQQYIPNQYILFNKKNFEGNRFSVDKFLNDEKAGVISINKNKKVRSEMPLNIPKEALTSGGAALTPYLNRLKTNLLDVANPKVSPQFTIKVKEKETTQQPQTSKKSLKLNVNIDNLDKLRDVNESFSQHNNLGTVEQVSQEEKDWLRNKLGATLKEVEGLIRVASITAVGHVKDKLITLSDKAARGIGYHEGFHIVFNSLSNEEQLEYYNEAEKEFELTEQDLTEAEKVHAYLSNKYSKFNKTVRQIALEEKMADEFALFAIKKESIFSKLFSFLQRIVDLFIKNTSVLKKGGVLKKFYSDIYNGTVSVNEVKGYERFNLSDTFTIEQASDLLNIATGIYSDFIARKVNEKVSTKTIREDLSRDDISDNYFTTLDSPEGFLASLITKVLLNEGDITNYEKLLTVLRPDVTDITLEKLDDGSLFFTYETLEGEFPLPDLAKQLSFNALTALQSYDSTILNVNTDESVDMGEFFEYSDRSINSFQRLSKRLKSYLSRVKDKQKDSLGFNTNLYADVNTVFSSLLSHLQGSVSIDDMREKLDSYNTFELEDRIKDNEIFIKHLYTLAQNVAGNFHTVLAGNETKAFPSNRYSIKRNIQDILKRAIDTEDTDSFLAVTEEIGKEKENELLIFELRQLAKPLFNYLPEDVVNRLVADGELVNTLRSLRTTIKNYKKKGKEFSSASYYLVNNLQDYFTIEYQPAFANVEGERVWGYVRNNFFIRAVNKLNNHNYREYLFTDSFYRLLPVLDTDFTFDYAYIDGLREEGKKMGRKYNNYTKKDLLTTMLAMYNTKPSNSDGVFTPLPILADAPKLAFVSMPRYSKQEVVDNLFKLYIKELELGEFQFFKDLVKLAESLNITIDSKEDFQVVFNSYIEIKANSLYDFSIKTGLLEQKNGKIRNVSLPKNSLIDNPIEYFKDYLFNYTLNHIQTMMLTTGNPSFYGTPENLYKRAKEVNSDVRYNSSKYTTELTDPHYRLFVHEDIETVAPQYGQIEEVIGKELAKPYKKSSLTDAGSLVDLLTFKHQKTNQEGWSKEDQELFEFYKKGYTINKKRLSKAKFNRLLNTARTWQVTKPFYYNLDKKEDGTVIPVQKKDSEFLITPAMGKMNSEYKRILEEEFGYDFEKGEYNLDNRKTDIFTFDTSMKAYKEERMDLAVSSWGEQNVVAEHFFESLGNVGSQIWKLIVANVNNFDIYNHKEKEVTGKELKDIYREKMVSLIAEDYADLREELFEVEDREAKLREILIEELRVSHNNAFATPDNIEALQNKEFPIWSPSLHDLVHSILASKYKKNVTRRYADVGFAFANVSAWGFDKQPKIVWNKEDDPNSGIKYLEAYAPIYREELFDYMEEDGTIDVKKVPKELLEGIGYRIPTEDKFSMIPFKIIGFLPTFSGSIVLPHEITTIVGLDFDIDKLYGFFRGNYETEGTDFIDNYSDNTNNFKLEELGFNLGELSQLVENNNETENVESDLSKLNENWTELFEIMWSILTSENTVKEMLTPQGFTELEKVNYTIRFQRLKKEGKTNISLEDFNKLKDQKEYLTSLETELDYLDPLTLLEVMNRMNVGKKNLSVYASSNAVEAVLQHYNTKLNLRTPLRLDGKEYNIFGIQTVEGSSTRNVGMRIGASADMAKNPQLHYYNAHPVLAALESMLLQVKSEETKEVFPSDVVQYFLAQNIVSEYIGLYEKYGSNKKAELQAKKILAQRHNIQEPKKYVSFPSKAQLISSLVDNKQEEQVTGLLLNLLSKANLYRDISSLVKEGDNGLQPYSHKTLSSRLNRAVVTDKLSKKPIFENAFEIIDVSKNNRDEIMKELYHYGIEKANEDIEELTGFKWTDNFVSFLNYLSSINNDTLSSYEIEDLARGYMHYALSTVVPFDIDFIEKTNERLKKLSKADRNNALLNRLFVKKGQGQFTGYIKFNSSYSVSPTEKQAIQKSWSQLSDADAEMLIKYALMISGFNYKGGNFSHFISPVLQYNFLTEERLQEYKRIAHGQDKADIYKYFVQFIRNNFTSLSYVPEITKDTPNAEIVKTKGKIVAISYPVRKNQVQPDFVKTQVDKKWLLFRHIDSGNYIATIPAGDSYTTEYNANEDTLTTQLMRDSVKNIYKTRIKLGEKAISNMEGIELNDEVFTEDTEVSVETDNDMQIKTNNNKPKVVKNSNGLIIIEDAIPKKQRTEIVKNSKKFIKDTSFKQTGGSVSWGWGLQWMRLSAMTLEQRKGLVIGKQLNGKTITKDLKDAFIKSGNAKNLPLYGYTNIDLNGNILPNIPSNIITLLSEKGIDISQYDASYNSVYDKKDKGSLIIHQDNTETNRSPIITISLGRPMKFITYELNDSNNFNLVDSYSTAYNIALNLVNKNLNRKPKYGTITPSNILQYAEKTGDSKIVEVVKNALKETFPENIREEYILNDGALLVFSNENRNVFHEIIFDETTNKLPMPENYPTLVVNKAFKGLNKPDKFVSTNDYRVVLTLRKVQGETIDSTTNIKLLKPENNTNTTEPIEAVKSYLNNLTEFGESNFNKVLNNQAEEFLIIDYPTVNSKKELEDFLGGDPSLIELGYSTLLKMLNQHDKFNIDVDFLSVEDTKSNQYTLEEFFDIIKEDMSKIQPTLNNPNQLSLFDTADSTIETPSLDYNTLDQSLLTDIILDLTEEQMNTALTNLNIHMFGEVEKLGAIAEIVELQEELKEEREDITAEEFDNKYRNYLELLSDYIISQVTPERITKNANKKC